MPRITLRAIEPSDADLIFEWENDRDIWSVSQTITPYSKHIIDQYIENAHRDIFDTKQLRLMIDLEEDSGINTIGTIDLFDYDPFNGRAGVGILIKDNDHRQKGYARAALKSFIQYAFSTLLLNQIYCNIGSNNVSSIKLFEAAGFQLIGVKKNWNRTASGYEDELMYQLLRS